MFIGPGAAQCDVRSSMVFKGPNRSGPQNSDLSPGIDKLRLVLQAVFVDRCKACRAQPRSVPVHGPNTFHKEKEALHEPKPITCPWKSGIPHRFHLA